MFPARSRKTSTGNASRTSCCWADSEFSGRFKLVVSLGSGVIPDLACCFLEGAFALFESRIAIHQIVRAGHRCLHPLIRVPGATNLLDSFALCPTLKYTNPRSRDGDSC